MSYAVMCVHCYAYQVPAPVSPPRHRIPAHESAPPTAFPPVSPPRPPHSRPQPNPIPAVVPIPSDACQRLVT